MIRYMDIEGVREQGHIARQAAALDDPSVVRMQDAIIAAERRAAFIRGQQSMRSRAAELVGTQWDGAEDVQDAIRNIPVRHISKRVSQVSSGDEKIARLVEALSDCLGWMETARTYGGQQNWKWQNGDEYTRGRAALHQIVGETE